METLWLIVKGSKLLQTVLVSLGVMVAAVAWLEVHDKNQQAIGVKNAAVAANKRVETANKKEEALAVEEESQRTKAIIAAAPEIAKAHCPVSAELAAALNKVR